MDYCGKNVIPYVTHIRRRVHTFPQKGSDFFAKKGVFPYLRARDHFYGDILWGEQLKIGCSCAILLCTVYIALLKCHSVEQNNTKIKSKSWLLALYRNLPLNISEIDMHDTVALLTLLLCGRDAGRATLPYTGFQRNLQPSSPPVRNKVHPMVKVDQF
jgi:hypothetical protein